MLNKEVESALNDQINAEFYSSYLYLSMAAWFEGNDLPGMARWMRIQSTEEWQHALKFYRYVMDRDGGVLLQGIDEPPREWESPLDVFKVGHEHEQTVSNSINDIVDLALKARDHATNNFLQWFVAEQVEEEATVRDICSRLRLVGNEGRGLFLIDQELASRTDVAPDAGETRG